MPSGPEEGKTLSLDSKVRAVCHREWGSIPAWSQASPAHTPWSPFWGLSPLTQEEAHRCQKQVGQVRSGPRGCLQPSSPPEKLLPAMFPQNSPNQCLHHSPLLSESELHRGLTPPRVIPPAPPPGHSVPQNTLPKGKEKDSPNSDKGKPTGPGSDTAGSHPTPLHSRQNRPVSPPHTPTMTWQKDRMTESEKA